MTKEKIVNMSGVKGMKWGTRNTASGEIKSTGKSRRGESEIVKAHKEAIAQGRDPYKENKERARNEKFSKAVRRQNSGR